MNTPAHESPHLGQAPLGENPPASDAESPRSLAEYVLNPRSLQALMTCGGGLLVLGLVIWLWTCGFFDNPLVMAGCLGTGNLALLAAGASLVKFTRYQTAGRAVTLLASLLLPLNLWFYDAQGLVTLANGGPLWVPAVVCCGLYALVARLLKDSLFVYTLVGGVAMTGLLLLADHSVNRFWEVLGPSTFLVLLGMVCVHVERLFTKEPSPFSRDNFGKAFFQSGHVMLGGGLALLLGGRLAGWMYEPLLASQNWFDMPGVASVSSMKLVALLLALGGTYTYVYSQLVSGRGRRYSLSAVLSLLWSEVILLDLLAVHVTESVLLVALASTALAANVAAGLNRRRDEALDQLARTAGGVGRLLTMAVVAWGSVALARGWVNASFSSLPFSFDFTYVAAMLVAAAATVAAARAARQAGNDRHSGDYYRLLALPLVGAAVAGCSLAGLVAPAAVLAVLMTLVLLAEFVCTRDRENPSLRQLSYATNSAAVFLLLMSMPVAAGWVATTLTVVQSHLVLAAFFGLGSVVLGWQATRTTQGSGTEVGAVLAGASGTAAVWQLLLSGGLASYAPVVAASVVGTAAVCLSRLLMARETGDEDDDLNVTRAKHWQNAGGVLVSLGAAGGLLMTLSQVLSGVATLPLVALAAGQVVAAGVAGFVATSADWRRWLFTLAGVHVLAGLVVVNVRSPLSLLDRVELFATVSGLLMLAAGHLGWRKEGDKVDPLVSFNLGMGSLLAAGPFVLGLLAQRVGVDSNWAWTLMHEVGVLSVGLGLLAAGVMCRVRWTTVVGTATLTTYVASLLLLVNVPDKLQTVSVYMMVGGGVFFGTAVLLSVYRDRLLALPERVRNGEGMFRVMHWR